MALDWIRQQAFKGATRTFVYYQDLKKNATLNIQRALYVVKLLNITSKSI